MAYDPKTGNDSYKRSEDFEKTVLANYKSARDTNKAQLDREIEDLSWQVSENQWDEATRADRGPTTIAGIMIPGRPMLTIPKIKQPMSIVDNQFRSAHLGVNIHPLSEDADDDTAEVMQDNYRAIERNSNAGQARWWAFDRAKQAGRGYYVVRSEYDDQTDDPFDQKICIDRILYQDAVFMDPAATKADNSDAQWGGITAWLPLNVFRRRWPNAELSKQFDGEAELGQKLDLDTFATITPEWVDNGGKSVQVAEYWHKEYKPRTIKSKDGKRERIIEDCEIRWSVLAPGADGLETVEEQEWNGDQIPIITAVWSELQPFDEERRFEGMVRPARDGAKLYNFMASEAVSVIGSLPKSPWIGDVEQFEPYLNAWKQSAVRIMPFLPYASVVKNGNLLPPPQRTNMDASGLGPMMVMLQQADDFIQSSTATPDPVLGKANSKNQSGKAIQALQGQSEASNSAGIQNFSDVTMQYEARVVLGMMKRLYDRKGRMVHVVNQEGDIRPVILNAPHVIDPKTGRPKLVPAPVEGQTTTMQPKPQGKIYDLNKGFYGVSVTIGKSFNTRIEQGSAQLASIMEADPELGVVLAPVFLRFQDGPGMKEAAELAKEYRDMKYPGLGKPKDGTETPEVLQQKLKASEMQIQQMQQAGAELQKQIETDQAKQQATMQKAQIDAQTEQARIAADLQKAQMDNETRIKVAEIAAGAKIDAEKLNAVISLALDRSKEAQAAFDRRHEAQLTHHDSAHESALRAEERQHETEMAERAHEQGLEGAEVEHQQGMEAQEQAQEAAAEQAALSQADGAEE